MCCAITKAEGGGWSKAPKSCTSAAGPPVDDPMATTRGSWVGVGLAVATAGSDCRRSLTRSMRSSREESTFETSSRSISPRAGAASAVGFAMKSTAPSSSALKTS